jgi:uncharacterized coiled-coil DUF342 family protein
MSEFKDFLDSKRKIMDKKATRHREERDSWHEKSRDSASKRNELNAGTRELLVQVQEQKALRDQLNEVVREKKAIRQKTSDEVKKIRSAIQPADEQGDDKGRHRKKGRPETLVGLKKKLQRLEREFETHAKGPKAEKKAQEEMRQIAKKIQQFENEQKNLEDSDELRAALDKNNKAFEELQEAADKAQQAHDNMIQWSNEVESQRSEAEQAHRELRKCQREADNQHHLYIVSLRCLHSIQEMIRAIRAAESGETQRPQAREEVQDLMSKLLAGDTLSTDELMQLQRYD